MLDETLGGAFFAPRESCGELFAMVFSASCFPLYLLSVVGVGPYGRIAGKCRDVVVSELVFTIGILFNGEAAEHVGIALSIGMDALQRQVDVYDFVDVPCHVIRQL